MRVLACCLVLFLIYFGELSLVTAVIQDINTNVFVCLLRTDDLSSGFVSTEDCGY